MMDLCKLIIIFFFVLVVDGQFVVGPTETPTANNRYMIEGNGGFCLAVEGSNSEENGDVVVAIDCNWSLKELWIMADAGVQNKYQWVSASSSKCLSAGINLQGTGNYTTIRQFTCQNPPVDAQLWSLDVLSQPYQIYLDDAVQPPQNKYWIRLRGMGNLCLSFEPIVGGNMYLYQCNDEFINQYFRFYPSN